MTPESIEQAAQALCTARVNRVRIEQVPHGCRPETMRDAYRIQKRLMALLGEQTYGWKVGATSQKARDFVGISDSSIRARMLAVNCYDAPADLKNHFFFMRALECEFAFTLGMDLPPGGAVYTTSTVLEAVESLHPAIEVSDSRYVDWTGVGGPALVADNCNDGAFVLGAAVENWRDTDLTKHAMTLFNNDQVIANGSGAEVITGPLGILVWLANESAAAGVGLRAGEVITTGSCSGVVVVEPGDRIRADFGEFGTVEFMF